MFNFSFGKYTKLAVFVGGVVAYAVGEWFGANSAAYHEVIAVITALGIFQGENTEA